MAVVAAAAMGTCHAFLAYADNLHFHGYALLLYSLAVWAYVWAMVPTTRRWRWWFGLTAVCLSAMACLTWECHLWMVLFIAVHSFLFACPVRPLWLAMLGLPLIVVLVCQTVQRRVAPAEVGVVTMAARVGRLGFLDDLHRRTIGFESATDTPDDLTLRGYPAHLLRRLQQGYGLFIFAAAEGVPVVSLWGPGRPGLYAPRGEQHRAVYADYPCSPCL
ncbi:MAG: hypothetical protein JXA69_20840 [Phycisphaerae bacterium]|nr:hypothetical protein [Phycisphaerae bacterium]